jgi:hypothetical protein
MSSKWNDQLDELGEYIEELEAEVIELKRWQGRYRKPPEDCKGELDALRKELEVASKELVERHDYIEDLKGKYWQHGETIRELRKELEALRLRVGRTEKFEQLLSAAQAFALESMEVKP